MAPPETEFRMEMLTLSGKSPEPPRAARETLSATEKAVLAVIESQPKGQGITSKEIIAKLKKKGVTLANSSLRKHIMPVLKRQCGVVNHRAAGGYMIS